MLNTSSLMLLISLTCVMSQNVIITNQGSVRGVVNDGYESFTGIPYATINDTAGRFKRAGIAPFWSGIHEAPQHHCSQTADVKECLRLDVHVPSADASPWPVMVWVAGGTGQYHPGHLVQQGVIVVVVYHRLGPHGFLCLKEEKIPGNAGVKDVVLALRWVRDNIVAFRGNPSHVVVAGQSFGAAIAEALSLSPMAQGLYHGVILQSGTSLCPWAFNYDARDRAIALGEMLGASDDVAYVLLNANIADLVIKSDKLDEPYFPFAMCIEEAFKNEERLLTEAPFDLLSNNKVNSVPMIIGYNSDEAYIFSSSLKEAEVMTRIARDMAFLLPEELKFLNERELNQAARQIKDMYFKNNISMATVLAYHRDAYFVNHIHRSVRLHASASQLPVFYYQFSHSGEFGVSPEPGVRKTGAAHSDELAYLFSDGNDLEGDDGLVQRLLIKLWTNFVKYLNPTPSGGELSTWEAVDSRDPRLLNIGTELEMMDFPHTRAARMWDDVFHEYYYARHRGAHL